MIFWDPFLSKTNDFSNRQMLSFVDTSGTGVFQAMFRG